ncbi:MAG: hypothetical protein J6W44_04240 [Oscillospiraceae bacterium]|nr:hypothetical protein [Oscillospiraceae bacterium]
MSSMLLIIVCGCHGKKGVPFITLIQSAAYLAFILFPIILKSALNLQTALKAVLGLPLITAVIINLGGYILAVTVTVAIEKYWWNQGDKYLLPSPAIMKAFGGLEHE